MRTTLYADAGSSFGGSKAVFLNSRIRALSFWAAALVFCSGVKAFFARTFGVALGLALGLALGFALVVALGFAFVVAFPFAAGDFFDAADVVVVGAFFLGLLVVLPVCPFGLDAGFVARNRRALLMKTPLETHPCPPANVDFVRRVDKTRSGSYDSCATRSVDEFGPLDTNRRTIARPTLVIMTVVLSRSINLVL